MPDQKWLKGPFNLDRNYYEKWYLTRQMLILFTAIFMDSRLKKICSNEIDIHESSLICESLVWWTDCDLVMPIWRRIFQMPVFQCLPIPCCFRGVTNSLYQSQRFPDFTKTFSIVPSNCCLHGAINYDDFVSVILSAVLILVLRPVNERRCYFVTTSLIGWAEA